MIQLIKADFYRIFHKKTMYAYVGFCALAFMGLVILLNGNGMTGNTYVAFASIVTNFMGLFIGTFIVALVYNDDLKSKSLQSAIGFGMKRPAIIVTKFVVAIIMLIIISLGFSALVALVPVVFGYTLEATAPKLLSGHILVEVIKIIAFIGLVSIAAFAIQKPTFVTTIFILLATGTFSNLLGLILGQGFIVKIFGDLMQYTPTVMGTTFVTDLIAGGLRLELIAGIVAYAVIGAVISAILFKNKELEF